VLSKESGAVAPALAAIVLAWSDLSARGRRRYALVYVASVALVVAAYLAGREGLLPGLGGAYGALPALVTWTDLPGNILRYALAPILVPFPGAAGWNGVGLLVFVKYPALVCLVPIGLFLAMQADRRRSLAAVAGLAVALLPVAWVSVTPGSTDPGRYLYLAGVWIAGIGGAAAAVVLRAAAARGAPAASVALLAGYGLASLGYQAGLWRNATDLSRRSVEQFAPLADGAVPAVFIPNLPYRCVEGPYVLKAYAFEYRFAGRAVPPVRAYGDLVTCATDPVRSIASLFDPDSDYSREPPGEHTLRLDLPVAVRGAAVAEP